MALVEVKHVIIPITNENNVLVYVIGIKLGDKDLAIISHRGNPLAFDTEEEAQEHIDREC